MNNEDIRHHISELWRVFVQDSAERTKEYSKDSALCVEAEAVFNAALVSGAVKVVLEDPSFVLRANDSLLAPLLCRPLGADVESYAGTGLYRRLTSEYRIRRQYEVAGRTPVPHSGCHSRPHRWQISRIQSGLPLPGNHGEDVVTPYAATAATRYSSAMLFVIDGFCYPLVHDFAVVDGSPWVIVTNDDCDDDDVEIWDLMLSQQVMVATCEAAAFCLDGPTLGLITKDVDGFVSRQDLAVPISQASRSSYGANDQPGLSALSLDPSMRDNSTAIGGVFGNREITLPGHKKPIVCRHTTRINGVLAVVALDEDQSLRLWDPTSGACLGILPDVDVPISDVSCCRVDGFDALVAASLDGEAYVWNLQSGEVVHVLQCDSLECFKVVTTVLEGIPLLVTAGGEANAMLWDLRTGERLHVFSGHGDDITGAFIGEVDGSPVLVTVGDEGRIVVWSLEHAAALYSRTGHTASIINSATTQSLPGRPASLGAAGTSPDSLATASWDNSVRIWDFDSGECIATWPTGSSKNCPIALGHVYGQDVALIEGCKNDLEVRTLSTGTQLLAFSEHNADLSAVSCGRLDGATVVLSGDESGGLFLWDALTGRKIHQLHGHKGRIAATLVCPDEDLPLGFAADYSHTIKVWDLVSGQCCSALAGHTNGITSLIVDAFGNQVRLASADDLGHIKIWNALEGECLKQLIGPMNSSPLISNNLVNGGRPLVIGGTSDTGDLEVWDLRQVQPVTHLPLPCQDLDAATLLYSRQSCYVVLGYGNDWLRIHLLDSGDCVARYHVGLPITGLQVSPDQGSIIVLCLNDVVMFRVDHEALAKASQESTLGHN